MSTGTELVSAESVVERAIQLTERLLVEVERRCNNLERTTTNELQVLSGLLSKLERALATVVKEQRSLAREGRIAGEAMGKAEKLDLLLEVFPSLPPDEQKALIGKLRRAAGGACR